MMMQIGFSVTKNRAHAGFLSRVAFLPVLLAFIGGCSIWPNRVDNPVFPHRLPPRINTIVIEPFSQNFSAEIASADVTYLQNELRKQLESRPDMLTVDEPPHELPSVAFLSGTVTGFQVRERQGDGIYVRSIEMSASIEIRFQASNDPPLRIDRKYSFQKVYLPQETVSTVLFDTQNALMELADTFVQALLPIVDTESMVIEDATDPDTRLKYAIPALANGNRYAAQNRFEKAILLWELVLYQPEYGAEDAGYRIARRALFYLGEEGMDDAELDRLRPLAASAPVTFVELRTNIRSELGEVSSMEDRILALANERENRIHLNIASAHHNLAEYYKFHKQKDLASFHYAMAYAHNPSDQNLDSWALVQGGRQMIPGGLAIQEAIRIYMRIPPPGYIRHISGPVQETVLPVSGLRNEEIQDRLDRIMAQASSPAFSGEDREGFEIQAAELPDIEALEPVPLEPVPLESIGPEDDFEPFEVPLDEDTIQ